MNTIELTPQETEKAKILDESNIKYALILLTETGLNKSILDATSPVVQLLKTEQIHDYDLQQQGANHKVILPCILLVGNERVETKVSLYRPQNRDTDKRFWPGRLNNYTSPDQVLALFIVSNTIVLLNLSDELPLDTSTDSDLSEMLDIIGSTEAPEEESSDRVTVIEDDESSEIPEPSRFEVSSYGWDSDVEGLVKRVIREDIKLPGFQRKFVWTPLEQSRFIESLILGLPVPNIFLAKDSDSNTLNIVDGQQRLQTLCRYLNEGFSISSSKSIQEDLRGRYFSREVAPSPKSKVLEDSDARTLNDSILHSIVIKPDVASDSPDYGRDYNKAIIQIFRRLNTSGKALQAQEVRSCIFYGSLNESLHRLNKLESWRSFFGREHARLKDVEAILRFFALLDGYEEYRSPMPGFLDRYIEQNRNIEESVISVKEEIFTNTINALLPALGEEAFSNGATFLLSKFDALSVGFARAYQNGVTLSEVEIRERAESILTHEDYINATLEFVNDTGNVKGRINTAISIFNG